MAELRGGAALQKKLDELAHRLGKKGGVRAGFLEGSTYPDGTSTATVAATQNWGSPKMGVPPRPFFSNMIKQNRSNWPRTLSAYLLRGLDTTAALRGVGQEIVEEIQQSIRDTNSPPLKPATIRGKGFDKPLIDTGHLINSAAFEVKS